MTSTDAGVEAAIARARAHALSTGALVVVQNEREIVEDVGVSFRVEWLSSLAMKDIIAKIPRPGDKAKDSNPFLPFEQDLWVADLSDSHVAILNKFPSFPGHIVLITREFVEQDLPLSRADIEACVKPLAEIGGYAFYNSGSMAGASQRHRHLQVLPDYVPPIEAVLPKTGACFRPGRAEDLPYAHVFSRIDPAVFDDPRVAADEITRLVDAASAEAGLDPVEGRRPPHNLMFTREWFVLVPRNAETSAGVSLSGLSYSGLIGLRSPEQLETVKDYGPMRMLIEAAGNI